jgi:hypothetical protein
MVEGIREGLRDGELVFNVADVDIVSTTHTYMTDREHGIPGVQRSRHEHQDAVSRYLA